MSAEENVDTAIGGSSGDSTDVMLSDHPLSRSKNSSRELRVAENVRKGARVAGSAAAGAAT